MCDDLGIYSRSVVSVVLNTWSRYFANWSAYILLNKGRTILRHTSLPIICTKTRILSSYGPQMRSWSESKLATNIWYISSVKESGHDLFDDVSKSKYIMQVKLILDVEFKSFVLSLPVIMMIVCKQFMLPFVIVLWLQVCTTHFGCMHAMLIKWIRSWESNSWSCTACQFLKIYWKSSRCYSRQ